MSSFSEVSMYWSVRVKLQYMYSCAMLQERGDAQHRFPTGAGNILLASGFLD